MGRKCLKPWMNLDLDHENPMSSEIRDFRQPKKNMYTSPSSRKQQNNCWRPSIFVQFASTLVLTWKQTENRCIVLDLTHDLFWVESSMRVCETAGEFMCSRKSRQPKENHIPVKKNSLSKCWCYNYKCNLNKNRCTTNYNVIAYYIYISRYTKNKNHNNSIYIYMMYGHIYSIVIYYRYLDPSTHGSLHQVQCNRQLRTALAGGNGRVVRDAVGCDLADSSHPCWLNTLIGPFMPIL